MGCFEGGGVPVLYIGRTVFKGFGSLRAKFPRLSVCMCACNNPRFNQQTKHLRPTPESSLIPDRPDLFVY
jgi:hypothetical protein